MIIRLILVRIFSFMGTEKENIKVNIFKEKEEYITEII